MAARLVSPRIAVIIPCHDEALTIGKVIADFQRVVPTADVYVYDNNSQDDTIARASAAGAVVRRETAQGKGAVVRRMFRDVEADFYVLVDGDDTYDPEIAPRMLERAMNEQCDLVNCVRREVGGSAYRVGHRLGNRMLTGMVRHVFGKGVKDMLSGYKVLSRRFVKSFPALSRGFDIETELAVHALQLSMPIAHVEGAYRGRPAGSQSKLSSYRDGIRILWLIVNLFRHEQPARFFSWVGLALMFVSVALGIPIVVEFIRTGLVPRFPTAILATGIALLAFLSVTTGLILDTVSRGRREAKMLAYLQLPTYDPVGAAEPAASRPRANAS